MEGEGDQRDLGEGEPARPARHDVHPCRARLCHPVHGPGGEQRQLSDGAREREREQPTHGKPGNLGDRARGRSRPDYELAREAPERQQQSRQQHPGGGALRPGDRPALRFLRRDGAGRADREGVLAERRVSVASDDLPGHDVDARPERRKRHLDDLAALEPLDRTRRDRRLVLAHHEDAFASSHGLAELKLHRVGARLQPRPRRRGGTYQERMGGRLLSDDQDDGACQQEDRQQAPRSRGSGGSGSSEGTGLTLRLHPRSPLRGPRGRAEQPGIPVPRHDRSKLRRCVVEEIERCRTRSLLLPVVSSIGGEFRCHSREPAAPRV